jgi:hypothetical protein
MLGEIYDTYYEDFARFQRGDDTRETKILVPIDVVRVARSLGVDPDIVFGRLYYHLEPRYGFKREDGTSVSFFARRLGDDQDCIHFPLLASVLAGLREQFRWTLYTTALASVSLAVAIVALFT